MFRGGVGMPDVDRSKEAFDTAVRAIVTTFGVFTGFVIKAAIDAISFPPSETWRDTLDRLRELWNDPHLFLCLATVALLLRFIIGSAVHLNLCYVVEPRSKMPVMLFKDVAFLIVFGLLAVFMVKAGKEVASFALRAAVFIAVGLLWSAVDAVVRCGRTAGEKSLFSGKWMLIDVLQLAVIGLVIFGLGSEWWQAAVLAGGFAGALYLDMRLVLNARKADPLAAA
jgi:hypothetical protein